MRRMMTDVPSNIPRIRRGRIRTRISDEVYEVETSEGTVLASYSSGRLALDLDVDIRMHPEFGHWRIQRPSGAVLSGFTIIFYLSGLGKFEYSYTVNGGATIVPADEILPIIGAGQMWSDIYYERWNGIGQPNRVHVVAEHDSGTRGFYYNSFDLSSGIPVIQHTGLHIPPNFNALNEIPGSIIVTPNGRIRIDGHQILGTAQSRYSDNGVDWTNIVANRPAEELEDGMIGWHDRSTGLDDSICWIYWDASATQLSIKRGTANGSAALVETVIATLPNVVADSSSAQSWRASTMHSNGHGHISLVAWDSDTYAASKSLKAWDIFGATITPKTDVITAVETKLCTICRLPDERLRCFYLRNGSIYYKDSFDEMTTWGVETFWVTPSSDFQGFSEDDTFRLVVDPLPGLGPVGFEASPWWAQGPPGGGGNNVASLFALGVETVLPLSSGASTKEQRNTTRGQIAWVAVP